jgi:GntR family transcriptional regulator
MQNQLGEADVIHRRGRPRTMQGGALQTSVRRAHVLLRAGIRSGALRCDEQLVETEVVEMLSTSRNAVRLALQMLEREGLVTRAPRNGTRVARGIARVSLDQKPVPEPSVGAPLPLEGLSFASELLECRVVRPPSYVLERLELEADQLMMGEHLVTLGGEPISVCVVYTADARGARCLALSMRDRADAFRHRYGTELGRSDETLEAVGCEARTSRLLGIEEGEPILLRETLAFGVDGRPRELTYKYNRGDRVSVTAGTVQESPRAVCTKVTVSALRESVDPRF